MLSKLNSAYLSGMDGSFVSVQVDESDGLPRSVVVGNVGASIREALDRAFVALKNSGVFLPPKRITVNLAPADKRKDGTYFDLPIVVGIMRSVGVLREFSVDDYGFFGEVGLDGRVVHVRGVLSLVSKLKSMGMKGAVIPYEDVQEAMAVEGMDIIGVHDIHELRELLESRLRFDSFRRPDRIETEFEEKYDIDFDEVHGQQYAVRAAMIAAAGGHNMLLSGTAGSGKTMIARRLPTIMPLLERDDNIEITKVYSAAGLLHSGQSLINKRPFRTPHHTITTPALIGGNGAGGIVPGEVALASKGVLFLDELPLFSKNSIEALRQPLEEKRIVVNRLSGSFTYPADCLLVGAMNPCPCGHYPDRNKCHCTPSQIRSYQRGVSKPILERIDILVEISNVTYEDAVSKDKSTNSRELRDKVMTAREIQRKRFADTANVSLNSQMGRKELDRFAKLSKKDSEYIKRIFEMRSLSMRTYHKVLKLARTIADIDESEDIKTKHLVEAVSYRNMEERLMGGDVM